jgi:glucose-1-phosphate cytidylyltransferase
MKAVIFAGGLGTRISEESDLRPKPMVEIGGRPILWHIMKMYSNHGVNDFVICLGYKGYMIKEYFYNYYRHTSDFKINLATGDYEVLNSDSENWTITFIETGLETQTGGRLKRVQKYLENKTFCLTYGDGVSNINISKEIIFHKSHGKKATVAAVQPPGRFATIETSGNTTVTSFREKHEDDIGWINGGFFVLEPSIFELIDGDSTVWEREPLESLVSQGELEVFHHKGFWQPMDSLREKRILEDVYQAGGAPWLVAHDSNAIDESLSKKND